MADDNEKKLTGCCYCCSCCTLLAFLIAIIVLTTTAVGLSKGGKGDSNECSKYHSCYECLASPCGSNNPMWDNNNTKCQGACVWDITWLGSWECHSITYTPGSGPLGPCKDAYGSVDVDTSGSVKGWLIFFGIVAGLALLIMACTIGCVSKSGKTNDYEHRRRWEAAKNKNCGHCSHKKHHGIRCYTQVNNPNYSRGWT